MGVGSHVTFCFLIFLFIITETKIHSTFWEKCSFSAFVSSRHNISFSLFLKIMGFAILLLCMTYWIENKPKNKKSSNAVFEMSLVFGFKYLTSLQWKVQGFFVWGFMHFIIQSALLDYSFLFLILVSYISLVFCYIRLVYRTSNFQIVAIALTSLFKDTFAHSSASQTANLCG